MIEPVLAELTYDQLCKVSDDAEETESRCLRAYTRATKGRIATEKVKKAHEAWLIACARTDSINAELDRRTVFFHDV